MPETVQITSLDGISFEASLFRAENPDSPMVVLFPALGVKASYYNGFVDDLRAAGVHVLLTDLRGNGVHPLKVRRGVDFGFREILDFDFPAIVSKARGIAPASPVYLSGHSLGGQLACLYASKHPNEITGIILLASCSVFYKGWDGAGRIRTLLGTQFIGLLANLLGYYPGKKLGFGGTEARRLMTDWSHTARTGRYEPIGSKDNYEELLKSLKTRVLAISYKGDDMCPKKAVEILYGKLDPSSSIEHHHLTGTDKPYNHFNWTRITEPTIQLIREWVQKDA